MEHFTSSVLLLNVVLDWTKTSAYFAIDNYTSGLYYKRAKIVMYDRNNSGLYYKRVISNISSSESLALALLAS